MRYVGRLRWTDIGDLLGITRQVAKRHHDCAVSRLDGAFSRSSRGTTEAADLDDHTITDDPTFDAAEAELDAWIQRR